MHLSKMDQKTGDKVRILYKLRIVKIGWLNEQMYHKLLKKESIVNNMVHIIQAVVFIINAIGTAIGTDVDYRWWTITTAIIAVFASYINKMKDDTAYGSKIELHRSMTDDCMKFTDNFEFFESKDKIEKEYESLLEKSSKLHIDPNIYDSWDIEFKKRGLKELNAFDITNELSKSLDQVSPREHNPVITITASQVKNNKAAVELQRVLQNLNIKNDEV